MVLISDMSSEHATFDPRLLHHMKSGENDRVESLLRSEHIDARDDFGTLLHHAAACNNSTIARRLIRMGCDVDRSGLHGKTALMVAVQSRSAAAVRVLLESGANIDAIDANGQTALRMFFDREYVEDDILRSFLDELRSEAATIDEAVVKLIVAGCTPYHAAYLGDFDFLNAMLAFGANVDSRGQWGRTALHVAVESRNLRFAKWLIRNGADVDAVDAQGNGALLLAASRGSKSMLRLLLEEGADPNIMSYHTENTPLFAVASHGTDTAEMRECMELLLQHGAMPRNRADRRLSILDRSAMSDTLERTEILVAHVAMLERMGIAIDQSAMSLSTQTNVERLRSYYGRCWQVLGTAVFGSLSLLDLLTWSENVVRLCVRNERFVPGVLGICAELQLDDSFPYYYNTLMKRIDKAAGVVRLENAAISVVRGFFDCHGNEYDVPARKVVDYLNARDLEQLALV